MTTTLEILTDVELRDIPGHAGYLAGTDGSIWSLWRPRGNGGRGRGCRQIITTEPHRLRGEPRQEDGRMRYTVRRADGTYRRCYGSALILETFVGPRPEGMEACHENGDCTDDSKGNLRWGTPVSNKADMLRHGTRQMGENHSAAKLSDAQIPEIIERHRNGESLGEIARDSGVSPQRIYQICKKGRR